MMWFHKWCGHRIKKEVWEDGRGEQHVDYQCDCGKFWLR